MNKVLFAIAYLAAGLCITGCIDTKQATYFNGVNDGTIPKAVLTEPKIQKNDLLSIVVTSLNPEATAIFNLPVTANANGANQENSPGYLVNSEGMIQFPVLGDIKAESLTKEQLKADIVKRLVDRQLLKDPIVHIRFLNFKITVLGEVRNPSVINVPNEKISLLEAIGMAGDLTIYGNRTNIFLMREEDGVRNVKRLNLNSSEVLTSNYYYLKPNDIVYVEPNKARMKLANANTTQNRISIIMGVLTLVAVALTRVSF